MLSVRSNLLHYTVGFEGLIDVSKLAAIHEGELPERTVARRSLS